MTKSFRHRSHPLLRRQGITGLWPVAALLCLLGESYGQGTMTVTFQGPPRGVETMAGADPYTDPASGVQFGSLTPQSLYLNGGGIPGYPDNGTCYLEIPAGTLRFGPNTFPPSRLVTFSLLSFDAAVYHNFPPSTLTVVGYKPMDGTVTNYFTVSSQTFQTFNLDASFTGVFQVDVLNASWSLDNVVISGVPEPSAGGLMLLGAITAMGWWRVSRRKGVSEVCRSCVR